MDNATRWVRVCPIQRNEFATDFHPVAATRSADVPRIMLPATSKEWAISGCSTGASNCDYMVQCTLVSVMFKRSWALLLSLICAVETEDSCFRYTEMMHKRYRCWYRSIFFDTDTEPMPAVSVDTKYPMPVSVSPYSYCYLSQWSTAVGWSGMTG